MDAADQHTMDLQNELAARLRARRMTRRRGRARVDRSLPEVIATPPKSKTKKRK